MTKQKQFMFCTKDLYPLAGEVCFRAGKYYPVLSENSHMFSLRNELGYTHTIENSPNDKGWCQHFITNRCVLVEKVAKNFGKST